MLSPGCRLLVNYERRMGTGVHTTLVTCKVRLSRLGHFVDFTALLGYCFCVVPAWSFLVLAFSPFSPPRRPRATGGRPIAAVIESKPCGYRQIGGVRWGDAREAVVRNHLLPPFSLPPDLSPRRLPLQSFDQLKPWQEPSCL